MIDKKTVTVIGAGNAGCAMAGDLALSGWRVNLYELPQFSQNLSPLIERGGIELEGTEVDGKANSGFAKLNRITSDIKEAVENAWCIMVNTQAIAHEEVAELLVPHATEEQSIFILPGNGGSLVFAKVFRERGMKIKNNIVESLTIPYGCRKTRASTVKVGRMLGKNFIAALPSKRNDDALESFRAFYPKSYVMTNVLEVAINNPNIVLHPAPSLLNMARIEFSGGDFGLYTEGFSPSVMKILEGLDEEIMRIQKGLDIPAISYKKVFEMRYDRAFEDHFYHVLPRDAPRGPFDRKTRYITEDVPIGMVLIASIGRWLGVPTPTFDAVINLSSLMNEIDYWKTGRTLTSLGLSSLSLKELKGILREGF